MGRQLRQCELIAIHGQRAEKLGVNEMCLPHEFGRHVLTVMYGMSCDALLIEV